MSDGYLTEEEVMSYLRVDSPQLDQLIRRGKLTAFRVGGAFVRYRKDQVVAVKGGRKYQFPDQFDRGWLDKLKDFLSFYSVYILLSVLVVVLVTYLIQA